MHLFDHRLLRQHTHPRWWLWLLAALLCVAAPAWAHKGSDAYLQLEPPVEGAAQLLRLSVALKDLDLLVPIDGNADAQITWAEVGAAGPAVLAQVRSALSWSDAPAGTGTAGGAPACLLDWQPLGLEHRSDGVYWVAQAPWSCPLSGTVSFNYRLMQAVDPDHRLRVAGPWQGVPLLVAMAPGETRVLGHAQAGGESTVAGDVWSTVAHHFVEGARHLMGGYDHVAFLLALVLPLRLVFRPLRSAAGIPTPLSHTPTSPSHNGWGALVKLVTAFTVGHSITLGLGMVGWLQPEGNWYEVAIAASIGISALLVYWPQAWLPGSLVAGAFGLIHGLGFAGFLRELNAPESLLPWALLGFNLGLETVQLAMVAVWVALTQALQKARWYRSRLVPAMATGLLLYSGLLVWERV